MKYKIFNEQQRDIFIHNLLKKPFKNGYVIEEKYIVKKRTTDQNSLYWLWITCISNETGNNVNDIHEILCEMFLPTQEKIVLGVSRMERTSTKTLDTVKFKVYLDAIQVYSQTELGITLPNPEDLYFEQFKEYYEKYL